MTLDSTTATVTVVFDTVTIKFPTLLDGTVEAAGNSPVTYYRFEWDNYLYSGLAEADKATFAWTSFSKIP
jgi:hypothetical protein